MNNQQEERDHYSVKPVDDNVFRGIAYGLLFSVPLWALIIWFLS